jgi:hypothetical protein
MGGLIETIECPACQKALRNDPDSAGMVQLCPFCEQAFVVSDSNGQVKPDFVQERLTAYSRENRVKNKRPRGIVTISSVGIGACVLMLAAAVLLALSCMNSVVTPVTEGVGEPVKDLMKEAAPEVPVPTTRPQKIMSTTVLVVFVIVFTSVCIGLLRRKEWARRAFTIMSWMMFAVYAGVLIGIFIMPGRPIKWWTLFLFLPAVVYFGWAFLYLRRKEIKGWFLRKTA